MAIAAQKVFRRGAKVMEGRDGEALIFAIGRERDRDAFRELYLQFQKPALNLAYYIVRDRDAAEEAVQEAMLRVWKSSAGFRGGSAKSWVLKIVARESSKQMQRRSRIETQVKKEVERQDGWERDQQSEVADQEVVTVLRRVLGELASADRLIISMYYSGNCSQDEIAEACGLSQRTVSDHLKKVRDFLRSRLSEAGFASMGESAVAGIVATLIESEFSVPPSLEARVMRQIDAASNADTTPFMRPSLVKPVALGLILIGGLVAVLFAGNLLESSDKKSQRSKSTALENLKQSDAKADLPESKKLFYRRWEFDTPALPKDIEVLLGGWKFIKAKGKTEVAHRVTMSDRFVAALTPNIPMGNFKITIQAKVVLERRDGTYHISLNWDNLKLLAHLKNFGKMEHHTKNTGWVENTIYISESFMDSRIGSARSISYFKAGDQARLDLFIYGDYRIRSIEIQEIEAAQMPDLSKLKTALDKLNFPDKNGKILLPQFKSSRSSDPVHLLYQRMKPRDFPEPE